MTTGTRNGRMRGPFPLNAAPTEAEWEHAARAGDPRATYAGDPVPLEAYLGCTDLSGVVRDIAWFSGNSDSRTHVVAAKKANGWGLYDMLGNVWEPVEGHTNYWVGGIRTPRCFVPEGQVGTKYYSKQRIMEIWGSDPFSVPDGKVAGLIEQYVRGGLNPAQSGYLDASQQDLLDAQAAAAGVTAIVEGRGSYSPDCRQ